MSIPRVSVIMPVYNRAAMVVAAARSVLRQTFTDFELIVVDDASSDGSGAAVAELGDPRAIVLHTPVNVGAGGARNLGLASARGEYIAFLDSDDLSLPHRLARQVAFLDVSPRIGLVGSWSAVIDSAGKHTGRLRRYPCMHADIEARQLFRCCIPQSSVLVRRELLGNDPYDVAHRYGEDWALFLNLAQRTRLANLPEALILSRRHTGQLSADCQKREALAEIVAGPVRALGLNTDQNSRLRHLELARRTQVDSAFLAWAHDWLRKILAANARFGRYEKAALLEATGQVWLKLLTRTRPVHTAASALAWPNTRISILSLWNAESGNRP